MENTSCPMKSDITKWDKLRPQGIEATKEFVHSMRAEGYSEAKIADALGISLSYLQRWCRWNGMVRNKDYVFPDHKGTLCWICKNATGGCSWSHDLVPVEGWTVEETGAPTYLATKKRLIPTVCVVKCPEFEEG